MTLDQAPYYTWKLINQQGKEQLKWTKSMIRAHSKRNIKGQQIIKAWSALLIIEES